MSDRLLDRLELGARVAQSLVAENDLCPASRRAAIVWRCRPVDAARVPTSASVGPTTPAPARPVPTLARAASALSCAA
jgi:hypothetical protein